MADFFFQEALGPLNQQDSQINHEADDKPECRVQAHAQQHIWEERDSKSRLKY